MLARLQQTLLASALLITAVWTWAWWDANQAVALAGLLLGVFGWTLTIALELLLLIALRKQDPTPKARLGELATAWWHECAAAMRVFGWWQPFKSHRWPNLAPSSSWRGRRGVVLVHGFVCNRAVWTPWFKHLQRTQTPFVAVNLEPVFSDIESYTQTINEAVDQMFKATGLAPLVVAHSMGGLAVRAWLKHDPTAQKRMHRCVTLGTPHHGTWLAYLGRSSNARQMRLNSAWLAQLRQSQNETAASLFVCWYSNCDNVVMPPATATWAGATNRLAPGLGHVSMVFDEHIMRTTLALLGPELTELPADHGASGPAQCSQTGL